MAVEVKESSLVHVSRDNNALSGEKYLRYEFKK